MTAFPARPLICFLLSPPPRLALDTLADKLVACTNSLEPEGQMPRYVRSNWGSCPTGGRPPTPHLKRGEGWRGGEGRHGDGAPTWMRLYVKSSMVIPHLSEGVFGVSDAGLVLGEGLLRRAVGC